MKTIILLIISLFIFFSCKTNNTEEITSKPLSQAQLVERGSYLVNTIGCADCHSPKTFGPSGPMIDPNTNFGGHIDGDLVEKVNKEALSNWVLFNMSNTAAVGPWGISYAANISSDATGIGAWSEEQFFRATREGQYKGLKDSRKLLPPMPWPNYAHMTDEDLRAIFLFLKSTKPVKNVVPQAVINSTVQ